MPSFAQPSQIASAPTPIVEPATDSSDLAVRSNPGVSALDPFPGPGTGRRLLSGNSSVKRGNSGHVDQSMGQAGIQGNLGSTLSGSASSPRRQSTLAQAQTTPWNSPSRDPVMPIPKIRRKSYFPSSNVHPTLYRPPRKSIGPGTFISNVEEQWHLAPTHQQDSCPTEPSFDTSESAQKDEDQLPGTDHTSHDHGDEISWAIPVYGDTPSLDTSGSSISKSAVKDTSTPLSDRRLSMMPNSAHATGLAARTISPTDAHRWKRMSTMQGVPPLPYTPPTLHSDAPYTAPAAALASPSLLPRKSITPSSSRTTPEHNRKSFSSGVSNSSGTSYNSIMNQSNQPRLPQSMSTSRLPTLKARTDAPVHNEDEVVPPVPAIPKAYESPKAEIEHGFFSSVSQRKSSLPYKLDDGTSSQTDMDYEPSQATILQTPKSGREPRRRPMASEQYPATERRVNGVDNINRRTLQQVQLPPLKLLPLSAPTAAKIAALYNGKAAMNLGTTTPQPKSEPTATPSTPMTASKASFSTGFHHDDQMPALHQQRSNSSHHTIRPVSSSHGLPDIASSHVGSTKDKTYRKIGSPFISSSTSQISGDCGQERPFANETAKVTTSNTMKKSKPTGPRSPKAAKDDGGEGASFTSPSTPTSSFGSSLRRKLSLTGRRSSKAQSRNENHADDDSMPMPQKSIRELMPPPRLPASATWEAPTSSSPTPSLKFGRTSSRRKVSNSSLKSTHERSRSNTWNAEDIKRGPINHGQSATPTTKKAIRIALGAPTGPSRPIADVKESFTLLRTLDRHDNAAEEEMRKLAAKRRDTERAAKELDALRKRANAKTRVSPGQALQVAQLNIFEKGEIIDFRDVYFCGTHGAKKHQGDLQAETTNFGYDDDRGDYNIVEGDHLAYRYEIIDILGKGSFGQVARCIDHKTGGLVAIKVIRNKKRFHQQALIEVDILQKLRQWVRLADSASNE